MTHAGPVLRGESTMQHGSSAAGGLPLLSPVESHRVIAVLEETLEKLTFLDRCVWRRRCARVCGAVLRRLRRGVLQAGRADRGRQLLTCARLCVCAGCAPTR